ncbi:hypothetical protein QBC36DRAFT_337536 [Triangularia setosa]|uniref:Heterokaryon incompatibility domain-containing protein n=1 Tax=Triangularia setosa TaxID=2587417 RepID=A0AAN6VZE6_9PEZI|nr:hypothetical protein QBC36DRAFT_337536 [Podospora setosa]
MDFLSNTSSLAPFLSCFSYNYATQSGQILCWVCTDILLVDPETGERKATTMEDLFYGRRLIQEQGLGSYHDISARQFCPMCRLVVQLLSNDKRLLPSKSSPAATGGVCVIQQHGATPMELRLTYVTGSPSSRDRLRPRGTIVVLSNEYPLPSGSYWEERPRFREYYLHTHRSAHSSELLDIDFVRYCLASCEKNHMSCSHPASHKTSGRSPADIFLINVQEECLEPGTAALRYLALSYVWGDGKFYKTRSEDVPTLRKHGSLTPSAKLFNVPRTVRTHNPAGDEPVRLRRKSLRSRLRQGEELRLRL